MSALDAMSLTIVRLLPEPHASLLMGMVFGVKATLPETLIESLRTTGTIHVVALSGMNISLLVASVQLVFLTVFKRPIANLLSVFCIIGFVLLVGPSASVVRAATMGSIGLLASVIGKRSIPLYTYFLAVIGMIVLHPPWLFEISFQLSALATLGLLLYGAEHVSFSQQGQAIVATDASTMMSVRSLVWERIWDFLRKELRVTLAAQVFTVPLLWWHFQSISIIAPVANVAIGWLISPVMILGMILVFLGFVWLPLAVPVSWLIWLLLSIFLGIIRGLSSLPFASVGY